MGDEPQPILHLSETIVKRHKAVPHLAAADKEAVRRLGFNQLSVSRDAVWRVGRTEALDAGARNGLKLEKVKWNDNLARLGLEAGQANVLVKLAVLHRRRRLFLARHASAANVVKDVPACGVCLANVSRCTGSRPGEWKTLTWIGTVAKDVADATASGTVACQMPRRLLVGAATLGLCEPEVARVCPQCSDGRVDLDGPVEKGTHLGLKHVHASVHPNRCEHALVLLTLSGGTHHAARFLRSMAGRGMPVGAVIVSITLSLSKTMCVFRKLTKLLGFWRRNYVVPVVQFADEI